MQNRSERFQRRLTKDDKRTRCSQRVSTTKILKDSGALPGFNSWHEHRLLTSKNNDLLVARILNPLISSHAPEFPRQRQPGVDRWEHNAMVLRWIRHWVHCQATWVARWQRHPRNYSKNNIFLLVGIFSYPLMSANFRGTDDKRSKQFKA